MSGGVVYLEQEVNGSLHSFSFWSDNGTPTGNLTPMRARSVASVPLSGTASASVVAGPFSPTLDLPINVTLTGTWTGSVEVLRSTDSGVTKVPITVAGDPWAVFTGNACEPVWEESESEAEFYLNITIATGTLNYRISQ